jgi:hypothetical protein
MPSRLEGVEVRCVVCAYSEVGYECLAELIELGVEVALVVTHEDTPGENTWFGSVFDLATSAGIHVIAPEDDVFLSGHVHNLRAWIGSGNAGVHVIAGSGASTRPVESAGQDFALPSLGFARVDLVSVAEGQRLDVSLFSVPRWPWDKAPSWPAARFHVDAAAHAEADASCRGTKGWSPERAGRAHLDGDDPALGN